jgi:hypothetical protein
LEKLSNWYKVNETEVDQMITEIQLTNDEKTNTTELLDGRRRFLLNLGKISAAVMVAMVLGSGGGSQGIAEAAEKGGSGRMVTPPHPIQGGEPSMGEQPSTSISPGHLGIGRKLPKAAPCATPGAAPCYW